MMTELLHLPFIPFCLQYDCLKNVFENDPSASFCIICATSLSLENQQPISCKEILSLKRQLSEILTIDESYLVVSAENFKFCKHCFEEVEKLLQIFSVFCQERDRLKEQSTQICYSILSTHLKVQSGKQSTDEQFSADFIDWNTKRIYTMLTTTTVKNDMMEKLSKESKLNVVMNYDHDHDDSDTIMDDNFYTKSSNSNESSLDYIQNKDTSKRKILRSGGIKTTKLKTTAKDIINKKQEIERICKRNKNSTGNNNNNRQYDCSNCEKSFKSFPALRAHNKVHLREGICSDGSYSCTHCNDIFSDLSSLNDHKKRHLDQRNFCPICRKTFFKGTLKAHLLTHYMKDPIVSPIACNICSKIFESPLILANHMEVHKGDFSCKIPSCLKSFASIPTLNKHSSVHFESPKLFDCDYCLELFENQIDLKAHIFTHIESFYKKKFLCDNCGLHFLTKISLKAHIRSVHTKIGSYNCDICEKIFANKHRLAIHKRIHNNNGKSLFSCQECNLSFNQKILLEMHLRHHSGIMPYKCSHPGCDHPGFSYTKGLRQHLFKEHFDTFVNSKKYVCKICYKNFWTEIELEQHASSFHENLKCKICNKQFKMMTHLKEHTLRHGQIFPHKCPHCPHKGYIRKKQLEDHIAKVHHEASNNDLSEETENIAYVIQLP